MKKSTLLLAFLFPCFLLYSQTYQLSVSKGDYQPLEKSISLTNGQVWDDPEYSIPIGFDFTLFNSVINGLHSNGGSSGVLTDVEGYYYDEESFSAIIPLFADLIDLGYNTGESLSDISYLVEGEEGSRICKVEWANAGFYQDSYYGTGTDFVNLQLWLYEDSGIIEFHYGDSDISNPESFFGNTGPTMSLIGNLGVDTIVTFDEFLVLDGDPSNPSIVYLDEDGYSYFYDEYSLDAMPVSGTIYRFSRGSVSTDEIRKLSTQFSVQPNPAQSSIRLKTQMDYADIESVSIYNSSGALMKTQLTDYDNIDLYGFSAGIYNMQILTNEGLARQRFVKID